MLIMILLTALVAIGLCIFSIFLFQEKGPIPTTEYILSNPEERKKLRIKSDYRFTGIIMMTLSIVFALMTVSMIFRTNWLFIVVVVICAVLVVYVVAYSIKEESKGRNL